MPKRAATQPTEAELEVLRVLWDCGESTVREVHEVLQQDRQTSMTTTLKILQVMTRKGIVVRDSEAYPHRYRPAKGAEKTQVGLLKDLARKAFDGSVSQLLVRAVEDGGLSEAELKELKQLIDEVRKG